MLSLRISEATFLDDEWGFAVSAVAVAECAPSDSVVAIAPANTLKPYCFRNCLRVEPSLV
jgi:hypothetical protein